MCNPIYMLSDANILFINFCYIFWIVAFLDPDISLYMGKKLIVKCDV